MIRPALFFIPFAPFRFSAIRNLGTFYFAKVAPWDWTKSQNNSLWRDDVKTLFDPCPAGWRVPRSGAGSASPWNAFGTNPYAAPFYFYINDVKQTALGTPAFVEHPNNGRRYDPGNGMATAWYPAPGYRDFGRDGFEGVIRSVGSNGYSWASSISGTYTMGLGFYYGGLNPSDAHNRGHGISVRCLRE